MRKNQVCKKKAALPFNESPVLNLPAKRHLGTNLKHIKSSNLLCQDCLIKFSGVFRRHQFPLLIMQTDSICRTYHHAISTAYAAFEVNLGSAVLYQNSVHLASINTVFAPRT